MAWQKKKKGRETDYPQLKWLKTNVDYIIVSKHQESRSNLAEGDLAWDLSCVAVTLVRATSSEVLLGLDFCESKGDGSQSELQEGKEENVRKWRRHSRENLRKERTKRKAGF